MMELIFDFATDFLEEADWRFDAAEAGSDDLIELWRQKIYAPYFENFIKNYGGTARKMELACQLCGKPSSLELVFDHTFLIQALETYAVHGWILLEAIKEKAAKTQTPATRTFIEATLWIVSVHISKELVSIEGRLMSLAKNEWHEAQGKVRGYLGAFEPIGKGGYKFRQQFRDREKGKQVFKLCAEYAQQLKIFEDYQKRLNERNSKDRYDPKKKLDRTYAQTLWHEIYAAPQREVMQTMSGIVKELGAVSPPAVLVLADLPPGLSEPIKSYEGADYWNRARDLDDRIYNNLVQLEAQLTILEASIQRPGQSEKLSAHITPITKPKSLLPGGPEAVLLKGAWDAKPEDNRVIADVGLVERLLREVEEQRPISWEHAVLKRYYVYLKAEVAKKIQTQKDWDELWGWVGRLTAALSILTLLAIPFSGVAVAPAIMTLLAIVSWGAIILVVITLLVDLFFLFSDKKEETANALREQMFKLGQTDPDALMEVGEVLQRNHELRDAMTTGLLLTLFKLALAKKIKMVALALELDGFLDDIQTLFAAPVIYKE